VLSCLQYNGFWWCFQHRANSVRFSVAVDCNWRVLCLRFRNIQFVGCYEVNDTSVVESNRFGSWCQVFDSTRSVSSVVGRSACRANCDEGKLWLWVRRRFCLSGGNGSNAQILNWWFVLLAEPTVEEDEVRVERIEENATQVVLFDELAILRYWMLCLQNKL
jgi:hypothetical protein